MRDDKIKEEYEDAVLSLAVSELLEEYGKELTEKYKDTDPIEPSPEAAARFEKALKKEIRKDKTKALLKDIGRIGARAATVVAVLIIAFSVSVVSVDAIRFRFLEWLTNVHENSHDKIHLSNDDTNNKDMTIVDNLPVDYNITNYNKDDSKTEIIYKNSTNEIIILIYSYYCSISADNEETIEETVYINDYEGIYQKKELSSNIIWYIDEKTYWIRTDDTHISKEELVEIAQSLH